MIRTAFFAAFAAFALTSPAAGQSAQDQLDARYDRALAAGYKALMLCSAIANAEANGATRTPESVHEWELTGIQAPLDEIVRGLEYRIVRRPTGQIAHVAVAWADDMPDRLAVFQGSGAGCSVMPIGAPETISDPNDPMPQGSPREEDAKGPMDGLALEVETVTGDTGGQGRKSPLAPLFDAALGNTYGTGRTTAVLVRTLSDDGDTIEEEARYAPGFGETTPQRTWSVAKSIAATLVGMAVRSREYAVSDPVRMPYWMGGGAADARNQITIDHALRMASGRYSDTPGNRTDPIYFGGSTIAEYMTKWPVIHPPGTVFRYANNDTLLAVKAIEDYLYFYSPRDLLAKLDMNHTAVETDWKVGFVLSSQVWSTAPDLANLGELYLRDGVWRTGERLLPENWRGYVSDPSGPQPDGPFGYGAGWWILNKSEGVPPDTFAAFGNRGQYVVVVPSRNVVIVRRGEDMVGTRFDIAAFTRDALAALD